MPGHMLVAVGGGILSGLFYAGALNGVVGLALVVQLPLFLVGLGFGTAAVVTACAAGLMPVLLAGGAEGAFNFALTSAAPVVVVTRQALLWRRSDGDVEWYPPGLLVTWLAGIAFALLAAAMVLFAGREGGLEGYVQEATAKIFAAMSANGGNPNAQAMAAQLAPIVPGLALSGWILIMAGNAALAQALLVRFGRAQRPSPRLDSIALPAWLPLAAAAVAGLAFLGGAVGFFGANALFIVAMPFFFAGLGVVHALARKWGAGPLPLVVFYMLTAAFGWPVAMIAGLGLVDQWMDFRTRWRRGADGKEG